MSESEAVDTRGVVFDIIKSKAWYGLNPETGAFDWGTSVDNIASALSLDRAVVNRAITEAFTPGCLSQVANPDHNSQQKEVSLLQALGGLGIMPHIWTVGDLDWQRTKFERSGASHYVTPDHFHPSPSNKIGDLKRIVDLISASGTKRIIVVDDKAANIQEVHNLSQEYDHKGVKIINYHMKLQDEQANANAFYLWLQQQLQENPSEQLGLVLDFDGVVADTDGVLFGAAITNLLGLLSEK